MKKENNNTNINTNIKNQEEKIMKREIKLEKFTDENMIRYEWELNALYQGREHFIRDFQELYINGNCQIEEINNAIPMMIDYINDFATSARVWNNILETSKYKSFYTKKSEYGNKEMNENIKTRILNSYRPTENDAEQVVYRIYATIAVAVYNATFAPDGQYRVVKMAYRDYKNKFIVSPDRYEYTCIDVSKCMAVYVKTGEYDPETKTIEVYIPANWDGDDARWWCARKAGDLPEIAAEMAQMAAEAVENDNNEENSTTEEEKEMKKEMIIDMVESTYEIVGKTRTISNCTGIDESKEEEFLGREDRAVMAAEYIFGHSEAEESENEKLLVDYYKNQPEEFFESWTDDDIAGEGLVERMAKDLLSAKANAPEFDKSDRGKLNIQDMYGVKLYRAEFLHTYRKLDKRDDVMEDYLTNFLTSYMTWHSLMIQTDGWHLLMRKFYGHDGVYEPMLDCEPIFADGTEGEQHVYSWADYVSDVTAWLYDMMKIALVCGTYAPNGKYKTVTYEDYEDWYMDTLDIRLGAEEKVHAYDEERDFRLYKIEPEKVDFDTISDFMIKFKYEEPKPVKEITRDELRELDDDELDEYFYSRRAYNEGIGKKKAYYRAA